jgi:hypothetical protein
MQNRKKKLRKIHCCTFSTGNQISLFRHCWQCIRLAWAALESGRATLTPFWLKPQLPKFYTNINFNFKVIYGRGIPPLRRRSSSGGGATVGEEVGARRKKGSDQGMRLIARLSIGCMIAYLFLANKNHFRLIVTQQGCFYMLMNTSLPTLGTSAIICNTLSTAWCVPIYGVGVAQWKLAAWQC